MGSNQIYGGTDMGDRDQYHLSSTLTSLTDRYFHLKEVFVHFIKRRPTSDLELVFKDDAGVKHKSSKFKKGVLVHWNLDPDTYVRTQSRVTLTIQRALFKIRVAQIEIEFQPNEFGDCSIIGLKDTNHRIIVNVVYGTSQSLADVARLLDFQPWTGSDVSSESRASRFVQLPQHAGELTQVWLNDDILLGIFDCYRLDEKNSWNNRLGWCKLSHVCQRWRYLIYECAFHLDMCIKCTNGTPIVDMLDHFPPLPLIVDYGNTRSGASVTLTEQDELGIYHALRLRDRVRHIELFLPPSILHKVVMLMDEQFPILEHLSLTFSVTSKNSLPPTLPKAFLAPNLRHLALPSISPPRRLQVLASTVSLVKLLLSNIETSGYFRPRLLVARLRSLPLLEELFIGFSIPIPRPSTERELLGEQRAPVTLPSLKTLRFKGVSAYLESLVAQIRVPLLEQLLITLFNQIAFALPHLSNLINITEALKLPSAAVRFDRNVVFVTTAPHGPPWFPPAPFLFRVKCNVLDWQIDCASQICHALIPALSGVEQLALYHNYGEITTELRNGAIDSATWHDLLRSFIGVQRLYIEHRLLEELSRALQVDGVGSDPGFLPNLRSISVRRNLFTLFIDTRQVAGRPVEVSSW